MVSIFLTLLSIALVIFAVLLLIRPKRLWAERSLLAFFFAVFFIDNLCIILANRFSQLQLFPNMVWDGFLICSWSGKLYSIVAMLILLYLFRNMIGHHDVGLTIRQNPGSILPAILVILILAGWAFYVGLSSPNGKLDIPTLAYLATMPGLNEELVYRGLLLGILVKIMPGSSKSPLSHPIWGVLVTSLLFGLLHGFWLDHEAAVHVDWIALRNATASGLAFAWLRVRTGSLVMPVVAHGLEDFLFFLPRMV